jgi:hypothetical protein
VLYCNHEVCYQKRALVSGRGRWKDERGSAADSSGVTCRLCILPSLLRQTADPCFHIVVIVVDVRGTSPARYVRKGICGPGTSNSYVTIGGKGERSLVLAQAKDSSPFRVG